MTDKIDPRDIEGNRSYDEWRARASQTLTRINAENAARTKKVVMLIPRSDSAPFTAAIAEAARMIQTHSDLLPQLTGPRSASVANDIRQLDARIRNAVHSISLSCLATPGWLKSVEAYPALSALVASEMETIKAKRIEAAQNAPEIPPRIKMAKRIAVSEPPQPPQPNPEGKRDYSVTVQLMAEISEIQQSGITHHSDIAKELNQRNVRTRRGLAWTSGGVWSFVKRNGLAMVPLNEPVVENKDI